MKTEEIRAALEGVSQETLADALAIVLVEGRAPSQAVAGMNKPELANFAQAIMYLKKNYDFDELEHFSTEADLVYVNAGDRRTLLTDRQNTAAGIERSSARWEEGAFEARSPGSRIKEEAVPENENTAPASGSDGGRFSNLEI